MLPTIKKYLSEKNSNLSNVSICLDTEADHKEFKLILDKITD